MGCSVFLRNYFIALLTVHYFKDILFCVWLSGTRMSSVLCLITWLLKCEDELASFVSTLLIITNQ